MGSQTKTIAIVIILILVGVIFLFVYRTATLPITKYLDGGESVTSTLEKYCSRLSVTLASTKGDMNLKLTVDGQTVYEQNNIRDFSFVHNMGFGHHVIHLFIQNPTVFGFGSTIRVSGTLSSYIW